MDPKFLSILKDVNQEIIETKALNLIDEGILDSFSIMNLISALENEYKFEFDPEDITPENFKDIDSIWSLTQKYIAS